MYAKLTIPERLKDLRVVDKHRIFTAYPPTI